MQDILVTGASGLIGLPVLGELHDQHRVWAMHFSAPPVERPGVRWIAHDLSQPALPPSLPSRIDTIIHLAQSPHFRDFPSKADHVFNVNVSGTQRLLDWGLKAGARRFILASSGGVYGAGNQTFSERDLPQTSSTLGYYLTTKRCAEDLVQCYAARFTVIILRFFFVYGARQKPHMLIPRLVRSVADGRPILLQGQDGIRINPIHVDDAARAVARCVDLSESHKINIAGPNVLTMRDIGTILGAHLNKPPRFEVGASEQPSHLVGDIQKMTALLGPPATPFEEGVREICRSVNT